MIIAKIDKDKMKAATSGDDVVAEALTAAAGLIEIAEKEMEKNRESEYFKRELMTTYSKMLSRDFFSKYFD